MIPLTIQVILITMEQELDSIMISVEALSNLVAVVELLLAQFAPSITNRTHVSALCASQSCDVAINEMRICIKDQNRIGCTKQMNKK